MRRGGMGDKEVREGKGRDRVTEDMQEEGKIWRREGKGREGSMRREGRGIKGKRKEGGRSGKGKEVHRR